MFENDRNRKTATQNGQKPINRTRIWWENANRKLLLKPPNRTKTARKIGKNCKTARKIDEYRKTATPPPTHYPQLFSWNEKMNKYLVRYKSKTKEENWIINVICHALLHSCYHWVSRGGARWTSLNPQITHGLGCWARFPSDSCESHTFCVNVHVLNVNTCLEPHDS